MQIYGPSLSPHSACSSSLPFLRDYGTSTTRRRRRSTAISCNCSKKNSSSSIQSRRIVNSPPMSGALIGFLTASAVMASVAMAAVDAIGEPAETLSNIPQTLSGECAAEKDCKRGRIQRPKSRKAESCTIKCVTTCIRGGDGSPGEGPLNVRRPLVVFKQGFRTRQYCLVECSDICNLIGDADDGP
ncbi:hypothetical protein HN51_045607 [Arachis hypogaea]|uniref:Uncharacterized protein n=1 Tax=Arachis hypogaea TaxID=3818 RepID=A0A444XY43_ARAHY|nr:uncharacterized protein LOC107612805 isoform X1 [Arachis ipaensis]XP_025671153.1 uncharacterized protein LOC112770894 [Arachis hypogaea]QHN97899.1 uncharacterized protein DS421_18g631340 [Arachis hypogaea]RYQ94591.1 hypothetical protein Ahy_B08g089532 [Arachis hypogaea]